MEQRRDFLKKIGILGLSTGIGGFASARNASPANQKRSVLRIAHITDVHIKDKKAPIESALNKLKEAHKTQDVAQIDPAVAELNNAWTAASEELYKATQGQAGPTPGAEGGDGQQQQSGSTAGGENVTDAEFEEVK